MNGFMAGGNRKVVCLKDSDSGDGDVQIYVGDYFIATLLADGTLELACLDGYDDVGVRLDKNGFIVTTKGS